jgi:hypothetical protein
MIQVETTSKVAAQVVPVQIDWTEWLGADTLSGAVTVTSSGDVTILATATADGITQFLMSGGTVGTRSTITATATAAGGKREVFFLRVDVLGDPA